MNAHADYVERVVDLLDPSLNQIHNMSLEEARRCVLSGQPDAVRDIDGSFALLARDGKTVRMARSMDRPMRYFLAKRAEGPALFIADRMDTLVGIFGLGNSGSDLALKAQAFHMRVLGLRRNPDRTVPGVDKMYTHDQFHAFLAESDFVVVTAPSTAETAGMFDEAAFRAMKPTAYFIVISRGGIADDAALLKALQEGWIAGAGLDAHGVEPLPSDSPFWDLPNVVITPHNGATTFGTAQRSVEIFVDNLKRFVAGERLHNIVNKQAGY